MEIKVKYLVPGLAPIKQAHPGEWYDLQAAYTYEMQKNNRYMIHLGVAIKLPRGYEAILVPRSSTFKNYGLIQTNGIGVIDNSYCGNDDEWIMPVYATRNVVVKKGARICQFRIQKQQPKVKIREVNDLGSKSRGGFGSTGK